MATIKSRDVNELLRNTSRNVLKAVDTAVAPPLPPSPTLVNSMRSRSTPIRFAAHSTGQPTSRHHVLKRGFEACRLGRFNPLPMSTTYSARKIRERFSCVHAKGSGCTNDLLSGSGRSTLSPGSRSGSPDLDRVGVDPHLRDRRIESSCRTAYRLLPR